MGDGLLRSPNVLEPHAEEPRPDHDDDVFTGLYVVWRFCQAKLLPLKALSPVLDDESPPCGVPRGRNRSGAESDMSASLQFSFQATRRRGNSSFEGSSIQ
jgi:hypothetical protein